MPINTPTGYLDITNATLRGSKIVTTGNIGIANANPVNHLSVGSNLHINDTHSNVLQISGNINAASVVLGGISIAPTFDLEIITNTGNTTPYTVEFNNTATAFVTTANATIGDTLTASKLVGDGSGISAIQSSNVTDFASNVSRITALESSRALGSDLDNNSARITNLSSNLSDNSSRITTVSNDLSDNSSRVTTLESGDFSISGEKTFTGQVIFESNIHMAGGNIFVANTINMTVSDPIIELGSNNLNTGDLGIVMTRHGATNSNIAVVYDESDDILRMGYTLNGANDTVVHLDSNALAVGVQGTMTADKIVASNVIPATSTTTGALTVAGGVGVGGNVHCTNLYANNITMNLVSFSGLQTFEQVVNNGRILNSNVLIISNATPSTSSATGALTLTAGGLGVKGNVYIGSNLSVTDETTLSNLTVTEETALANIYVTGETVEVANLAVTSGSLELTQVANVFQVKSSANVVTEYVRSKKLIKYPRVAMTAATSGGYTASASTTYTPYYPYLAFDNVAGFGGSDFWHSNQLYNGANGAYSGSNSITDSNGTTYSGEHITLQLANADGRVRLQDVRMHTRTAANADRMPTQGVFLGSNDGGTTHDTIHTFKGLSWSGDEWQTIQINASAYYSTYTLVTEYVGSDSWLNIGEIEYYGAPEYDPDAHGTNVIARSAPNVPNTDWLEVYYDGQDYTSMPSTITDKSGNSVTGTPTNVTFDSTWKAFTFNVSSPSSIATSSITTSGGDLPHSWSVWIKPEDVSGSTLTYMSVFALGLLDGGGAHTMPGLALAMDQNKMQFGFNNNNLLFSAPFEFGKWVHVAMTYAGGGTTWSNRKLYVNGIECEPLSIIGTAANLNISTSASLDIGTTWWSGDYENYNGALASLRFHGRTLSSDEIWQLYAYQKDYFQVSPDALTFKGGRLGIGTEEPKAVLDVRGSIHANGGQSWPVPTAVFSNVTPSNTGSTYYDRNIGTHYVHYNTILKSDTSGTIGSPALNTDNITLHRTGMYEFYVESALALQGSNASHIGMRILNKNVGGSLIYLRADGYEVFQSDYNQIKNAHRTQMILVTEAPVTVGYYLQPQANYTTRFKERAYGNSTPIHVVVVKYLG